MKAGEKVDELLSRTMRIITQIRSYGDTIEDRKIVPKLLRSLPPSFYPIVTTIEESKDIRQPSLTALMGSLKTHEERLLSLT